MTLTEKVEFKALLQRCNKVQVPKLVRWRYKIEPWQILKITVCCPSIWDSREEYLTRMAKDGRLTIPKLSLSFLLHNKLNHERYFVKVSLEPS
jgi:hypothetical protein